MVSGSDQNLFLSECVEVTLPHPAARFAKCARVASMTLGLALVLVFVFTSTALADNVFQCRINAIASRDFKYSDKPSWCGPTSTCGPESNFEIRLFKGVEFEEISYREYLLSFDEKFETVTMKVLWWKGDDGKPLSKEFDAHVVSRDPAVVFFMYVHPAGGKVHSYAFHLEHKKLVTASVMDGTTSLVTRARTFDCQ